MLRWKPGDEQYVDTQRLFFTEKQESVRKSMRAAIVKRQYLLKLKAKYAGLPFSTFVESCLYLVLM